MFSLTGKTTAMKLTIRDRVYTNYIKLTAPLNKHYNVNPDFYAGILFAFRDDTTREIKRYLDEKSEK